MNVKSIPIPILIPILIAIATPVAAQRVQTGISRDTIRVGDPFRAVVRVDLPAGSDAVLPDSLISTADIESAGKVRVRRDTAGGGVSIIAAYPLTAWRPGPLELPTLPITVKSAAGETQRTIALPGITVMSVLPVDTTNIQPKPPKDVLGANRVWWPWLLGLLLALALAVALYLWYRKRRKAQPVEEALPMIMPRERALEEIERLRRLGLIEQKEFKRYYTLLSDVLRQYMQTVESSWRTTLTTEELSRRVGSDAEVKPAIAILRHGDLVKFARSIPDGPAALRDLERSHEWIGSYPAPTPAAVPAEAA